MLDEIGPKKKVSRPRNEYSLFGYSGVQCQPRPCVMVQFLPHKSFRAPKTQRARTDIWKERGRSILPRESLVVFVRDGVPLRLAQVRCHVFIW